MNTEAIQARLEEIKTRLEKASEGPWELALEAHCHIRRAKTRRGIANTGGYQTNISNERVLAENIANADLVANAPSDEEWLVALVESLLKEKGEIRRETIEECAKACEGMDKDIVCPEECAAIIRALAEEPS